MLMKILRLLKNILFIILVVLMTYCVISNLIGMKRKNFIPGIGPFKVMSVLSGSMKPVFNPGDVIIDEDTDIENLKAGDIITFKFNNSLTTHRITGIINKDGQIYFRTKGDNNNIEDADSVNGNDVISRYLFRIPLLGFVITFMKGKTGMAVLWLLIMIIIIREIYKGLTKNKTKYRYR